MVKLKIKPGNVLRQVYTLFFSMLVLLHTSCGERPEEDAIKNAQEQLNEQFRNDNDNPQTQFQKALRAIGDNSNNDENQREGYTKVALEIIENYSKDLDTEPKSPNNALNLVLGAMKEVSNGANVLRVLEHTRIEKYIRIFKALCKKGVRLDDTILNLLTVSATIDDGIEILYYPLVVLGALNADATSISPKKVPFKQKGIVKENIPILWWALRNPQLNMELKKEMVKILVEPKNVPMINEIFTIPAKYSKDSAQKLTPAMYMAYHEHTTADEQNANDSAKMFEYFLDNPGIKLLEKPEGEDSAVGTLGLNGAPLLSFIVFNATRDVVKFRDRWLAVLDKALALQSGDLGDPKNPKKTKKPIKEYVQHHIDPYINQEGSGLNENEQKRLIEVRARLEEYIGETIPPTKAKTHDSNGNGKKEDNNKKQKNKKNKGGKDNS
ncbi:hypothetical protein Aasi_1366 [Candidatus Amoebophilus asiaticus 5a2]|uniref:Uncharacterized protein n=1 Tax=Amoebophilus asiaticus (strain 5a2) TaxID=452471 RepID=B3ETW8_AMOA5|nr:hypothetical protein [Candidatus Amoebophilus asiaticus]ACE06670.1 hypothetical protein Aasi_1366 [Candidatus Amoebophilus asiaticus 5a2]